MRGLKKPAVEFASRGFAVKIARQRRDGCHASAAPVARCCGARPRACRWRAAPRLRRRTRQPHLLEHGREVGVGGGLGQVVVREAQRRDVGGGVLIVAPIKTNPIRQKATQQTNTQTNRKKSFKTMKDVKEFERERESASSTKYSDVEHIHAKAILGG